MRRFRLHWQLYPTYVILTLIALAGVAAYTAGSIQRNYRQDLTRLLETRARLVEHAVLSIQPLLDAEQVDALCKTLGDAAQNDISFYEITVFDQDARRVGASRRGGTDPHQAVTPELEEALAGRTGSDIRLSAYLKTSTLFVAIPLRNNGEVIGAVRTALSLDSINRNFNSIFFELALWGAVLLLIALGLSRYASKRISQPLHEFKNWALRIQEDELSARVSDSDCEEIGGVAESINRMAEQLQSRINSITRQNSEQEAILASMIEGVVAVDQNERIILINHGAIQLLDVTIHPAHGRKLHEVVRNTGLLKAVSRALRHDEPFEDEIIVPETEPRYLRMNGAPLLSALGERIGAVVVLNEVTRLRRLENIRRDFVANVSHELKTPITSIKGFVETLLDGAMDDADDATRFLGIIAKQSDRLHAIIEDLLTLSRIEQNTEKESIELERIRVKGVLRSAIESCDPNAAEKQIIIDLECEDEASALINPALIEQAMVNLIDNAIKYSEEESRVLVQLEDNHSEIHIHVQDWGVGVDDDHLPRLFERFYRVDKARSRKMGGTGLGLAIEKHIAQAHGGRVTVKSKPGEGSTFSLHLQK
ncbi:cell wall metabolism sensor histidine kinase WalK [bacterium]|nr:cell wall metabolism sensor histidine kinase WalK [bacterium]